jgi:hypothetical protein
VAARFCVPTSRAKCCVIVERFRNRVVKEPYPCRLRVRGAAHKDGETPVTCVAHRHLEEEARAFLKALLAKVDTPRAAQLPNLFKTPLHLEERCGEPYCLCSGGKHAACKTGARIDRERRDALEALTSAKVRL